MCILVYKYVYKYVFKGPDRIMAKFCDCHICSSLVLLGLPVWSFCVDLVFFDISASMIPGRIRSHQSACLQAIHRRWCHFVFLLFFIIQGCKQDTWSRPVTPMSLSPGHTPKMVPTVKLVSTMDEPSRGSNATLNPSPTHIHSFIQSCSICHQAIHRRWCRR